MLSFVSETATEGIPMRRLLAIVAASAFVAGSAGVAGAACFDGHVQAMSKQKLVVTEAQTEVVEEAVTTLNAAEETRIEEEKAE